MARCHYIVRVGNEEFSAKDNKMVTNHWHYLSPQHLWGLPKSTPHVNVRASFIADIIDPRKRAYIWFLCNSHGGPGHFVGVGIGRRHLGNGPIADEDPAIPANVMARLREGFDHWFNWDPVSLDASFQDQLRRIPAPKPTFIPTLRRVTAEHPSLPVFEALIEGEDHQSLFLPAALPEESSPSLVPSAAAIIVNDLENLRREQAEPSSQGYVYLIHMEGTMFYKIGMSLDPQIRLRTLQTGNPHKLEIINTQAVDDMRGAESSLHGQFEAQRVLNLNAREWFCFGSGIREVDSAFSILAKT